MTDRELLELVARQVATLTTQVDVLTKDMTDVKASMATKEELAEIRTSMTTKEELAEIKTSMATKEELQEIKDIVVRIENDHGQKLGALFDGYRLNSEKLDRIEKEVAKHEEFILRRIR